MSIKNFLSQLAARSITGQKQAADAVQLNQERLESLVAISQRRTENTQELLDVALEEAIRLTRSRIGYIYFYSEEKREFTLNSWSRDVMRECAIAEPQETYQLEKTGIWGEAVRQRKPIILQDYAAPHLLKKGYPPGHVHLRSFLTVPVFQQDRVVAVVGVANKQTAYDRDDISQLTLLIDAVWRMVEQKRIETALRENAAVLRSFLNAVTESALLIDREGRILAANETVAKRLGMTASTLVGSNAYDSLPRDVAESRKIRMDAVLRSGVPDRFEDERRGQIIDNSIYPVFDPSGAVSALAIIGIDITERKRAVSALEFSEKKYHMLYDSAIDGIFIVTMDGTFIDVNQTAYERLGYTREEMLALHVSRLDPSEFAAKLDARVEQLRYQGRLIFETAHQKKDGTIMPVEINARIIDYEGRKAIFSIVRDITERKQAEQEREKLIEELRTALAEIKTLHCPYAHHARRSATTRARGSTSGLHQSAYRCGVQPRPMAGLCEETLSGDQVRAGIGERNRSARALGRPERTKNGSFVIELKSSYPGKDQFIQR
ncbi:MAG: PAS domain S-box protein [Nitrospirota bacterium]